MQYEISRELAEAVAGVKIDTLKNTDGVLSGMSADNKTFLREHINSFFFYCKEWAIDNGYLLQSGADRYKKHYCQVNNIPDSEANGSKFVYATSGFSEQQAVFNACEWILKEKKCNS